MILYGNHTTRTEQVVIPALLHRKDFTFLGIGRASSNLLPNLYGPHVLPIIPRKFASDSGYKLTRKEKRMFTGTAQPTKEEAAELNRGTFSELGKRIQNGGIAGIFPASTKEIEGKWFPGIGRIIEQLPPEMRDRVILAPMNFSGITKKDIGLGLRRHYVGKEPKAKKVTVKLGNPMKVSDLMADNPDEKAITERLRTNYLESFGLEPSAN